MSTGEASAGVAAKTPRARSLHLAFAAGAVIGVLGGMIGLGGAEFRLPLLVGSLSLAVSLPTMLVAFARYSQDQSFQVLRANRSFVITMAAGSIAGTIIGGALLGIVPSLVLVPLLVLLLLASSVKVWRHG